MVFVLLTYGGWNEAAYLSADVRDVRRDMFRILMLGTAIVTALYVLINLAYLHVLGLEGLRKSSAIAADVMRVGVGDSAATVVSLIVCVAALSTINASIFTGARLYHALGDDLALSKLSSWSDTGNNPRNAILMQSAIAFGLVILGALARDGFTAMVEYTAPVFWSFLLLVGISLDRAAPARRRPRPAVPDAAISADPDRVLPDLRLSAVFQPGLHRRRRLCRRRRAAGRRTVRGFRTSAEAQTRHAGGMIGVG